MLRATVIVFALGCIAGGLVMLARGQGSNAAPLFIIGVLFALGTIFEARRYRPKPEPDAAGWEKTSERFIDPSTGKLTEVRYNPQTGEREYVDAPR